MDRLKEKKPRYVLGRWEWDEKLSFRSSCEQQMEQQQHIAIGGFKFLRTMDDERELIFRKQFCRDENTYDYDVVLVQDIKNVALFLAPSEMLNKRFVNFVHTEVYDRFIHALIIYFEYFLKVLEFVLIRRDDTTGELGQQQTNQSTIMKRVWSAQLSQYRLMVAREYKPIVLGEGEMAPYYHLVTSTQVSQTERDMALHEQFLAFSTQVVWIAMHRRAITEITAEFDRLFRSEHFMTEPSSFTRAEASMLYGKSYKRVAYHNSSSPLVTELLMVEPQNKPLLAIGHRKYRGTDNRIHQMELEFIVPESQLLLIGVVHGLLGHPRKIYDSLLNMNWLEFCKNFTEKYDPYRIMHQPQLEIPKYDTEKLRQHAETYQSHFEIKHQREKVPKAMLKKWVKRDEIIDFRKKSGIKASLSAFRIADADVKSHDYGKPTEDITKHYLVSKHKLRKVSF